MYKALLLTIASFAAAQAMLSRDARSEITNRMYLAELDMLDMIGKSPVK
jgi:hypothetical protein